MKKTTKKILVGILGIISAVIISFSNFILIDEYNTDQLSLYSFLILFVFVFLFLQPLYQYKTIPKEFNSVLKKLFLIVFILSQICMCTLMAYSLLFYVYASIDFLQPIMICFWFSQFALFRIGDIQVSRLDNYFQTAISIAGIFLGILGCLIPTAIFALLGGLLLFVKILYEMLRGKQYELV